MKNFQLDECFNDRRLAETCNSEGRCRVMRYPERLKCQKDSKVLPDLLVRDAAFLTTDFTILDDNAVHIPQSNSGLIVVRSRFPQRPFTARLAAANLLKFKQRFPRWFEVDWSNLYVEIDEEEVMVSQLKRDADRSSFVQRFDQQDFGELFFAKLDKIKSVKITRDR